MVCSTAILSSTLALSLLRQSSPPSQSFVLSPFSLNTALSIVHDGADGTTQKELTNLLLNGCSPADVTDFYSSLALSIPSANETGVSFKSANRFYVDDSISLKNEYQKHIENKYNVRVDNIRLRHKEEAAGVLNTFVKEATNGKIKDVIKADEISDNGTAILINAIHFMGKWQFPFDPKSTKTGVFYGAEGERNIDFMRIKKYLHANLKNDFGTVLLIPYKDRQINFFCVMPKGDSNLETLRNELTGEILLNVIKSAEYQQVNIIVPKFKIEAELDGAKVLKKMGVKSAFEEDYADFSRISYDELYVSKIQHNAIIEMTEEGTEATASTYVEMSLRSASFYAPPTININRPFLFGILRNDDILFIGQSV